MAASPQSENVEKEIITVAGKSIKSDPAKYGIKSTNNEWYNGWGELPACVVNGDQIMVHFTRNKQFRNIIKPCQGVPHPVIPIQDEPEPEQKQLTPEEKQNKEEDKFLKEQEAKEKPTPKSAPKPAPKPNGITEEYRAARIKRMRACLEDGVLAWGKLRPKQTAGEADMMAFDYECIEKLSAKFWMSEIKFVNRPGGV